MIGLIGLLVMVVLELETKGFPADRDIVFHLTCLDIRKDWIPFAGSGR